MRTHRGPAPLLAPTFVVALAVALVPAPSDASALEVHLLDAPALSLSLDLPAALDAASLPDLGLGRPVAGLLQAIVAGFASYMWPGFGQLLLGHTKRGLLLMAVEFAFGLVGVGLLAAGGAFRGTFGTPTVAVGFAFVGLFGLAHIGGIVDATLLGLRTEQFPFL